MSTSALLEPRPGRLLEKLLALMAPVHSTESASTLLLTLNSFLLLASYYVIKTVRDGLILSEGGAEVKSYSSAGQALLLLLVVPAYSAFASRVNRSRLISWVTLFFTSHLILFYAIGQGGWRIGVVFFIWAGIFNVLVIAQFWAFANDLYTEEQGKRLFAVIGIGASLGAWLGPNIASWLFKDLGPYRLLLLAAAGLVICIGIGKWAELRAPAPPGRATVERSAGEPLGKQDGFAMIFSSRYLLLIAVLILLLNAVNTTGGYLLDKLVVLEADKLAAAADGDARRNFIGAFYGSFYGWVNLLSLILQMFLVSRVFRAIGVRGAMFVLPLIALGGYTLLLIAPLLSVVRIAKVMENATDYSIQNTARHALFLPTSREAKYKAKAAIDTFFWRAGDVLQAVIVFLGTSAGMAIQGFAALNIGLVGLWLFVVVLISREHRKLSPSNQ